MGLKPGLDVLDLACGTGIISCELARFVAPGRVVGLDGCQAFIQRAGDREEALNLANLSFRCGDIYEPDLPADSFDFVYARFVFQHLEKSVRALRSIKRLLKPGGLVCVVDVDDDWLGLYPPLSEFLSFTSAARKGQKENGGDRNVGQKLVGYMHEAGLREVRADIQVITSFDLGLKKFLQLTTLFKREQISRQRKERTKEELARLRVCAEDGSAWGAAGIFVVTGRKDD
ncbi:class I SAM-dependent methyltransferase [Dethiosulfatarculus sandiegensis]|uniref:Methyltransferase type 11 domain-containing protein n=1 Tax=Dethiosulfatarculus sandiegensis TaxID=1429043 RepID=A0A0D2JSV3_9BACT|nr:class I SAM-dependent methyltransferase [Dethiosulfatarculus sandiegensis]KIX12535.1 hypothetical protein X474_18195 [Dethiosulfatarculus sandiegensis]